MMPFTAGLDARAGYNIAMDTNLPYFEMLKTAPESARRFHNTMSFAHASGWFEDAILLDMVD